MVSVTCVLVLMMAVRRVRMHEKTATERNRNNKASRKSPAQSSVKVIHSFEKRRPSIGFRRSHTPSIRLFFAGTLPPSLSLARLLLGFLEGDTSLKFGGTVVNALSEKLGFRPKVRPRRLVPMVLDARGVDGRWTCSPPGPGVGAGGESVFVDGPTPGLERCSASKPTLGFREDVGGGGEGESRGVEGVHNFTITSGLSGSSGATSSAGCCSTDAASPSDGGSILRICRYAV